MGFFTMLRTLKRWAANWRSKAMSTFFRIGGSIPLFEWRNYESYLQAGTRKLWATWRACHIVATQVQATPFVLTKKTDTKPIEVRGLSSLLNYVNDHETFADLLYKYTFHMKLVGIAFWLKSQANVAGNRPLELFSLNPARIKFSTNSQGQIIGYIYYSGGESLPLSLDEVIVFKNPHPNNDYYGLGEMEAGEDTLQEVINRQNYQKAFFANGAAPSGVLICEDNTTDEEAWKAAQRKWNSDFGGKDNAGKIAWLTGKWKFERIGLTAQEMEDLDRTKHNIETIFMLHGVPLSIAGVREASNYATAEIEDQNFRRYTVAPLIKILQDTLQTDLIEGWGDNLQIRFDFSGLLNVGKAATDYAPIFDRGGMSVNEFREKCGLPRVEGNPLFDQHMILSAYTPLDLAGVANADAVAQQAQRMVSNHIQKALLPASTETEKP